MKSVRNGIIAILLSAGVMADDTEIFFGTPSSTTTALPFVMLSLDTRANLGSNFCTDVTSDSCKESLGGATSEIYLALTCPESGGTGDCDGINGLNKSSGSVDRLDAYRAAFSAAFNLVDNVYVGMMLNHEQDCTGSNCDSNGGYVVRGFKLFDETDSNGAKQELIDILGQLPRVNATEAHPYQGSELFFEFYRYLIGGDIENGHLGYSDYASQNPDGTPTRNLNYAFSNPSGAVCSFNADNLRECESQTDPDAYNALPPDSSNHNLNKDGDIISPWLSWDETIEDTGNTEYVSPYTDGDYSCSKTYSVNVMFQVSNQEDDSNDALSGDINNTAQGLDLSGNPGFTDVIKQLYDIDHASSSVGVNVLGTQNVTSYFIVENINTTTTKYATAGGTTPFEGAANPEDLKLALDSIFRSIASVSTTFTAASVPVNVQNRTESLPDMYLALFKVDENGLPFWPGNVKKLSIREIEDATTGEKSILVVGADTENFSAFNSVTGRIRDDALTFWTDATAEDVINADTSDNEVSGLDGSSVERGGAGHKINGFRNDANGNPKTGDPTAANSSSGGRQLFITPATVNNSSSTGNALIAMDADSTSSGSLAADTEIQKLLDILVEDPSNPGTYIEDTSYIDEVESAAGGNNYDAADAAQALLKWARGIDVFDWDGDNDRGDARPWMLGDVLHSRPLVLNYGEYGGYSDSNQNIRLVFGSNDGFLHMITNTATGGDQEGIEDWGIMPRELIANIPDLVERSFVGEDKPYGIDLPPTSFVIDNDGDGNIERGSGGNSSHCTAGGTEQSPSDNTVDLDCDKAFVYFGLRRGGKSYYGMDFSDPDDEPRLLWKISNSDTDFSELGLTFSSPRLGWVRFEDVSGLNIVGSSNVPVPVLIFGGGLYGGWTNDRSGRIGKDDITNGDPDPEGAAVYMVHARTGQLIWKAVTGTSKGAVSNTEYHHDDLEHSVPAAITPVDSNGNGITDRLYFGDTGGTIWRIDLPEYNPNFDSTDTDYHAYFRRDNWRLNRVATLGALGTGGAAGTDTDGTTCNGTDDRRFFHALSVVQSRDSVGAFDGLAIGTGDRAHPRSEQCTENWFYLIKDRFILTGDSGVDSRDTAPLTQTDIFDITDTCLDDSNDDADSGNQCSASDLTNGWRLKLEATYEKNLSIPLIAGGNISFTTYLPEGDEIDEECQPSIGISRLYQVSIRDGSPDIYLHGYVEGHSGFTKEDRYVNLGSGIDGGVSPLTPEFGGAQDQSVFLGDQAPETYMWRESGIDVLDD